MLQKGTSPPTPRHPFRCQAWQLAPSVLVVAQHSEAHSGRLAADAGAWFMYDSMRQMWNVSISGGSP